MGGPYALWQFGFMGVRVLQWASRPFVEGLSCGMKPQMPSMAQVFHMHSRVNFKTTLQCK